MRPRPTIRRVPVPADQPADVPAEKSSGSTAPGAAATGAVEPVPAASVVLLRDGERGLEVLMLRRTAKASFAADAWVFPGGRIDPGDGVDPGSLEAARRGAARETLEEAGVVVDPQELVPFSQWCPPPESPKRFLTWFFLAAAPSADDVTVDGAEITEHEWVRPQEAIAARDEGRITLLPPTWVTLWELGRQATVADALAAARATEPTFFETHIAFLAREDDPEKKDVVSMWAGDAGYESRDPDAPGARHRLRMGDPPWRYERTA
jgi:8-oxo-dGTP pyrophosphatase MutT (NUDIX family)